MGDKKKLGKAGCISAVASVVLMFTGIMVTCYSVKLGTDKLLVLGIILSVLPLIAVPILTLLPAKLRGVEEVPRGERIIQMLMMLFFVMLIVGFVTALVMAWSVSEDDLEKDLPLIISGCVAAVGFVGVIVTFFVNKRVTGKDSVTIQLFPENEKTQEVSEIILDKVLKTADKLSAEERERELERIEKNTVGAMSKEQVEEYENKKHLF
ncbi:MAG: hypothetical protein HDT43_06665 [Ruminococcaceae bacterium]|nr:hypothetical protein [Oscillospiraceae bacterium]